MSDLRPGVRFRHARLLDTEWVPGPGERYADAPHAVCRVTVIRGGRVYYTIGAGTHAHAYFPLTHTAEHVGELLGGNLETSGERSAAT